MILCPIGHTYLPYQQQGIEFAATRSSVLIADEMGLGKTVQAIGWMNAHPEIESVLVVCPATLKINWRREIDRWLVSPVVEVEIINYDVLHKLDMGNVYDLVILDEAHYIKSPDARRSMAAKQIQARHRIALTGTPILNRPVELYGILQWLKPSLFTDKAKKQFERRYCAGHLKTLRFGRRVKKVWDATGASNLDELRYKLNGLMIRRLKADVLKELPPKRRQIIELSREDISWVRDLAIAKAEEELAYDIQVKGLDDTVTAKWDQLSKLRLETAMAKLPAATQVIFDAIENSGKVVVFAHHHDVIDYLVEKLPRAVRVDGRMGQDERQVSVDRFQNDPMVKVFVGQIQAAGVGLTLTAASHVIFVELDWTPGLVSQAEDRCHRIGQKASVLVQHLVLEDSLDAKMAKALVKKQEIIERALDAQKGAVHV